MPATALPSSGGPASEQAVGCDTRDMVVIHDLFRSMFEDCVSLVAGVPEGDTVRADVVSEHLSELVVAVHHHHEGEDSTLWTQLQSASPGCAPHVARMRAQHAAMGLRFDELTSALPGWRATASAASRAEVSATLRDVLDSLREHLGDEEASILPIASRSLTQAAWDRLGEAGRASVRRDRMFVQLGFILDSMPDADREKWRREFLPGPVRLLYALIGRRQYRKHRARVYGTDS